MKCNTSYMLTQLYTTHVICSYNCIQHKRAKPELFNIITPSIIFIIYFKTFKFKWQDVHRWIKTFIWQSYYTVLGLKVNMKPYERSQINIRMCAMFKKYLAVQLIFLFDIFFLKLMVTKVKCDHHSKQTVYIFRMG